ncbi:MAG: hypothetical protein MRECE_12c012 [Mycoplasmataceae bacterium CE_OT135]|nr:MAG: hypothetical protein MRECE_12c012 [Mycoplasmataceae bacterium CE_OT135]
MLCHLFKHLNGVKFTNLPTPQGTYTLSRETLENHLTNNWGAPNRWYYFLDDIQTFQKWSKKNLGHHGHKSLKDFAAQAGKLGGTFLWTNNGIEPEPPFKTAKNATWKVVGYITFLDYSLLILWKTYWFTLIPIDNKEITAFYDPHWNIPQDYQRNWLKYIAERMKGEELDSIIHLVEQNKLTKDWTEDSQIKWQAIQKYNKLRELEEKALRAKKKKFSENQKKLKRYGLKTEPLTFSDLAQWDQAEKRQRGKKEPTSSQPTINEQAAEFAAENEGMVPPTKPAQPKAKNKGGDNAKWTNQMMKPP